MTNDLGNPLCIYLGESETHYFVMTYFENKRIGRLFFVVRISFWQEKQTKHHEDHQLASE
jgi:hypothetical protein